MNVTARGFPLGPATGPTGGKEGVAAAASLRDERIMTGCGSGGRIRKAHPPSSGLMPAPAAPSPQRHYCCRITQTRRRELIRTVARHGVPYKRRRSANHRGRKRKRH